MAKNTRSTIVAMVTITVAMVTNLVTMNSISYDHTNTSPIPGLSQSELRLLESKTGTDHLHVQILSSHINARCAIIQTQIYTPLLFYYVD